MVTDLHTPRLHLRPLRQDDETLYRALYTDAEVMRHVAEPLTRAAAQRAFVAVMRQLAADPPQSRYWILASRDTGEGLGLMALVPDRDDDTSAEVGVLLRTVAQGQGYAVEAIAALVGEAFSGSRLQRLWARHALDNAAMAAVMRRLGFRRMEDATAGAASVRWELGRQVWLVGGLASFFASQQITC